MIKAVLFDLDDTLTDRPATLSTYAAHFHREFGEFLGVVTVREIESTIILLDDHGYRPRDEVYAGIVEQLAWVQPPDTSAIRDHWNTWFLPSTVASSGLIETLAALTGANLYLGVVTNGSVLTQSAKIAQLGISHYLATVIISEAVQCKKPSAQIFQCALKEIGRLAGETFQTGDFMAIKQEDIVRGFKIYNLVTESLLRMLDDSGTTLEEARAASDAEEQKFFDENQRRIDELKAKQF